LALFIYSISIDGNMKPSTFDLIPLKSMHLLTVEVEEFNIDICVCICIIRGLSLLSSSCHSYSTSDREEYMNPLVLVTFNRPNLLATLLL